MSLWNRSSRQFWYSLGAAGSMAALAVAGACSVDTSKRSEIDSYDLAVNSQRVEDARAFIEDFRGSHLVGDLVQSLSPEVAIAVCSDLPVGVSGKALDACREVQEAGASELALIARPIGPLPAAAPTVASFVASGCGGTMADIVPSAGGTKPTKGTGVVAAAMAGPADEEQVGASAVSAKPQLAVAPATASSRLHEEFNGRGGKAGDGGGRNSGRS